MHVQDSAINEDEQLLQLCLYPGGHVCRLYPGHERIRAQIVAALPHFNLKKLIITVPTSRNGLLPSAPQHWQTLFQACGRYVQWQDLTLHCGGSGLALHQRIPPALVQALEDTLVRRHLSTIHLHLCTPDANEAVNDDGPYKNRMTNGEIVTRLSRLTKQLMVHITQDENLDHLAYMIESIHTYCQATNQTSLPSSIGVQVAADQVQRLKEIDPFGIVAQVDIIPSRSFHTNDMVLCDNLLTAFTSRFQKITFASWAFRCTPTASSSRDVSNVAAAEIQSIKAAIVANQSLQSIRFRVWREDCTKTLSLYDTLLTQAVIPAVKENHRIQELSFGTYNQQGMLATQTLLKSLPECPALKHIECGWDPSLRDTLLQDILPSHIGLHKLTLRNLCGPVADQPNRQDQAIINQICRRNVLLDQAKQFWTIPRETRHRNLAQVVLRIKALHDEEHGVGFAAATELARGVLPEFLGFRSVSWGENDKDDVSINNKGMMTKKKRKIDSLVPQEYHISQ